MPKDISRPTYAPRGATFTCPVDGKKYEVGYGDVMREFEIGDGTQKNEATTVLALACSCGLGCITFPLSGGAAGRHGSVEGTHHFFK